MTPEAAEMGATLSYNSDAQSKLRSLWPTLTQRERRVVLQAALDAAEGCRGVVATAKAEEAKSEPEGKGCPFFSAWK